MAEVLGAVTTATKFFFEVNQISIDNWSFKCFYKITTSILLTCSLISSTKQFFGEPIQCDLVSYGTVLLLLKSSLERWRSQSGGSQQLLLDVFTF